MKKSPLITQKELSQEYIENDYNIIKAINKVLMSGRYILGQELERFEQSFAEYVGTKYAVGVGNGFDALYMALNMIKPVNVYIYQELFIASTNAVILSGHNLISEPHRAEIIIPVISAKNGEDHPFVAQYIIEDACQSIGMKRKVPSDVFASCYSFHPLKLLHCYGDGGAIAVNDKSLYKRLKEFRNHGRVGKSKRYGIGVNSRLDEIQAAVLNVMLEKGIKCGYL